MKDQTRKWICIPAYIIVALCALLCSYGDLGLPGSKTIVNRNLLYFYSTNSTVRTIINIVLLLSALVTLSCAIGWMIR